MSKQDYYDVLGVARNATKDELKSAFRNKAKQFHPDKNKDDAEAEHKFKAVGEAYDVLKDGQKRAAYDQFGHAAFEGGSAGPGAGGGPGFQSGFADVFDDLFGEFMGGRRQRADGRTRGSDLRYNLSISLEEAFKGSSKTVRVPGSTQCEECNGSGAEAGSQPVTCPTCSGHGKVRAQQGFFTIERGCPTCNGLGKIIKNPCNTCHGEGRVHKERSLNVSIPAGVEDGTRIRLAGEGEAGLRGGPTGDLYIFLEIPPHSIFQRDGANLYCQVPLAMTTAALGGHVEVPTLDGGRTKVTIPAGAQAGKQFRLRGKGMPVLRQNHHGDLYIECAVETPVNLSTKQKELLKEFEAQGRDNSPQSKSFFSRAKAFWDGMKD